MRGRQKMSERGREIEREGNDRVRERKRYLLSKREKKTDGK